MKQTVVRITDVGTPTPHKQYLARTEADCLDDTDLSAYRSAVELNQSIAMGKVIAEPFSVFVRCCDRATFECHNESNQHDHETRGATVYNEDNPYNECREHACGETMEAIEEANFLSRQDYIYGTGQGL